MKGHAHRRTDAVARDVGNDPPTGRAAGEGGRGPESGHQGLRTVSYDDLQVAEGGAAGRRGGPHGAEASGATAGPDAAPEAAGARLDQWQRPTPVRVRLWLVDPADCGSADCAEVRGGAGRDGCRATPR